MTSLSLLAGRTVVICLLYLYSFRNWQSSQPNNAGGIEHCAVYSVTSFALNDRGCGISLPFICEMSKCKYNTSLMVLSAVFDCWNMVHTHLLFFKHNFRLHTMVLLINKKINFLLIKQNMK